MQTFLPYADFAQSAKTLDGRRLGKQRVEALQILRVLAGITTAWQNHPAVRMWRGHAMMLTSYFCNVCAEWISRGYKDTCVEKARLVLEAYPQLQAEYDMPAWVGNEAFHASHRSNLLRKDPVHYGRFFSDVSNDLPYIWPVP
jgi:hypothetical protein